MEVEGTATWNGQPIQKGYIELQPVNDGHFASAEIVDGKFTLQTTPGLRLVKVTAEKKIGETPPTDRIPEAQPIMFQFVPPKFNSSSVSSKRQKSWPPSAAAIVRKRHPPGSSAKPKACLGRSHCQTNQQHHKSCHSTRHHESPCTPVSCLQPSAHSRMF